METIFKVTDKRGFHIEWHITGNSALMTVNYPDGSPCTTSLKHFESRDEAMFSAMLLCDQLDPDSPFDLGIDLDFSELNKD
jgi:hypothetical protein